MRGPEDLRQAKERLKGGSEDVPHNGFALFRSVLEAVGGTFSKTYDVKPNEYDGGSVIASREVEELFSEPDLLACGVSETQYRASGDVIIRMTLENLKRMAQLIEEKYSDIHFEFKESPDRKKFAYTVTLSKAEK